MGNTLLGLFLCPTRRFFCDTGHHERCRPLHARFLANRLETSVPKQRLSMSSFARFSRVVTGPQETVSMIRRACRRSRPTVRPTLQAGTEALIRCEPALDGQATADITT